MDGVFSEASGLVWVGDVDFWARDAGDLLCRLGGVLARLVNRGLCAATHKAVLIKDETKWYARLYSGEATQPDPDRAQGVVEFRRPKTGEDLMHFIHGVNWMRSTIPALAVLEASLRNMLE